VLVTAARLVYGSRKYDQVNPLLKDVHWLRLTERIAFLLAVLVYTVVSMQWLLHILLTNFTVWLTLSRGSGCVIAATKALVVPNTVYTPQLVTVPFLYSSRSSLGLSPSTSDIITVTYSFSAPSQDETVYPVI